METLGMLLKSPMLASFVNRVSWMWPVCEILHFVGMALLIGMVGLLDLRLLGVAKSLPVAQVQRLIPWGIFGFVLSLLTGIIFISGDALAPPIDKLNNLAFELKLLFLFLAGINVLAFYLTGVSRAVDAVGPGDDAPLSAKVIAALSLFLWIGVIYFGRMIMYQDDLYLHKFFTLD
jgi:hypothetical protein